MIPGKTAVIAENRDGTIDTQAGSHPYSYTLHFELKTDGTGKSEGGEMRDVLTDLPPGLFGNPLAVPRCSIKSFEGGPPKCDPSTQVGVLHAILPGTGEAFGPLYNLTPQPGSAALLGFKAAGLIALLAASLSSEDGYSIHVKATDLPVEASARRRRRSGACRPTPNTTPNAAPRRAALRRPAAALLHPAELL